MKIVDVKVDSFRFLTNIGRDYEGHPHPGEEHWGTNSMLTIVTDEGAEGYFFGAATQDVVEGLIKPALVGEDPFFREKLWYRLKRVQKLSTVLHDMVIACVDCALWDLAGRYLNVPVYKMMGAARTRVPAYASIMPGDEIPGGLSTPEEYSRFAQQLVAEGYQAIKLHTWMPPISWAPDVKKEVAACEVLQLSSQLQSDAGALRRRLRFEGSRGHRSERQQPVARSFGLESKGAGTQSLCKLEQGEGSHTQCRWQGRSGERIEDKNPLSPGANTALTRTKCERVRKNLFALS